MGMEIIVSIFMLKRIVQIISGKPRFNKCNAQSTTVLLKASCLIKNKSAINVSLDEI